MLSIFNLACANKRPKYFRKIPKKKGTVIQPQSIFFDFESTQDSGEHIVNFCIAQRACEDDIDLLIEQLCKNTVIKLPKSV